MFKGGEKAGGKVGVGVWKKNEVFAVFDVLLSHTLELFTELENPFILEKLWHLKDVANV